MPALIEALKDEDSDVRLRVVSTLGEIGDTAAVPSLRQALMDEDKDVREAAEIALALIGVFN